MRFQSLKIPAGQICAVLLLILWSSPLRANVPGGVVSGSSTAVTLTGTASSSTTSTLSNGIVSILCTKAGATINQINYTFSNSGTNQTLNLLSGGNNGGQLYWEHSNNQGMYFTYSVVADPATNGGEYAEIALSSTTQADMPFEVHFSMRRGSPGFYVTAIWMHNSANGDFGMGECRNNIYAGSIFNWMSVDATRNKLMQVSGGTSVGVPTAPVECSLWTNGIYQGLYEDKYKYSATFGDQRVWGWSSVGASGKNVGLWDVSATAEYYNGGPLKPELMEHIGTTILNMFNGGHYGMGSDGSFVAGETWAKVCGPYFVYCNNVSKSVTDPVQASQALYTDALAQGAAEASAWPYSWFSNTNYAGPANRGTVTGNIVISDTGNPSASASNLWVGLVQQPVTSTSTYDFQQWMKPYQFWVHSDANGNFTIPAVIAGSNYTLYAFGQGAPGTFMSQAQMGGSPPLLIDLPASPFSVTVTGGSTTALGNVTWSPARIGATVFEIGYPDRTGRKFRHGEDWWVGDIGASPTAPSPVWSKWLEYPFDFPTGPNYLVGTSRWTTDWNFCQPVVLDSAGNWNNSTSTVTFTLPTGTSLSGTASLYLGLASDYYSAIVVGVNGSSLVNQNSKGQLLNNGITGTPNNNLPSTGYYVSYGDGDATIREACNASFSDERINFPASLLHTGTTPNTITIHIRQAGGGYFADHAMYDYLRLELTGYVPSAPASITGYAGNNAVLLSWPVKPGATGYNILRSTSSGANYSTIASGISGPACGSGPTNATWLDTTAANGTTYYYVVQSANTTGTSANSPQSSGITPSSGAPTAIPAAPTGVAATGADGSVTVAWNASTGANYYTLRRSTLVSNGGGTYNTLGTIVLSNTITGTTYTDNSPTNGSTYSYSITASNAGGTGAASAAAGVIPLPAAPSSSPSLTAMPGTQQVTLSWSAVPSATGYILQVATTPGGPYSYLATVSYLTYTDYGQADNTTYYYVVAATNPGGTSANSPEASATTSPAPPTALTAIAGNTQVTIGWTAAAAATSYVILRGTASGGPYTTVGTSDGTTFTDNSLINSATYYYVVESSNANGTGVNSTEVSVTPVDTVPVAPASVTQQTGNRQIVLNWTASSGATGYSILRGTSIGGPYTSIATGVSAITFTDTLLTNGVTYYYVVVATNATGSGAYSSEINATPISPAITWSGTTSTAWDMTTVNWLNSGTIPATYNDGYTVTFDDTGSRNSVIISGTVTPDSVIFSNSTLNYSVSSGVISGSTGLVKSGTGVVTFNNVNSYTGDTVVNGGAVAIGVAGSTGGKLGTGTVQLAQGTTLQMADSTGHNFPSNPVQIAAGASATISSAALANGYSGGISGSSDSILNLVGSVSLSVSGSAQLSAFNGLVVIPSGSQLRFSPTGGANGNGGANASFQVDGLLNTRNSAGSGGVVLGSLSGSGRIQGQSNTTSGNDTYLVGSKNIDSVFSGAIANGSNGTASLTKVGSGTLTLSGSNSYTGATIVSAGVLKITGTVSSTSSVNIASGSVLHLTGGSLTVSGAIANNGIFRISGASTLTVSGTFTNNGVLDLINGAKALPAHFINNGTVIDGSAVVVSSINMNETGACTIQIFGYGGHTYQLQSTPTLTTPNWQNVGDSQTVPSLQAGSFLIALADSNVNSHAKFYRIAVMSAP